MAELPEESARKETHESKHGGGQRKKSAPVERDRQIQSFRGSIAPLARVYGAVVLDDVQMVF